MYQDVKDFAYSVGKWNGNAYEIGRCHLRFYDHFLSVDIRIKADKYNLLSNAAKKAISNKGLVECSEGIVSIRVTQPEINELSDILITIDNELDKSPLIRLFGKFIP